LNIAVSAVGVKEQGLYSSKGEDGTREGMPSSGLRQKKKEKRLKCTERKAMSSSEKGKQLTDWKRGRLLVRKERRKREGEVKGK